MASSKSLVKLLSIDGGGIRGLAVLVILEQVIDFANEERRKFGLPRQEPWQMFDIIGGTSTGGLIAIMLGRLRMPLDKCKEAYMNLSQRAFTPKNMFSKAVGGPFIGPSFKAEPLEQAIREILEAAGPTLGVGPEEALLYEENGPCKVFVVSHLQNIPGHPTIFRSYRNVERPKERLETLKIWQACRGTSAATTFFEPLAIGKDIYFDGGLLYNNPVQLVHIEGAEMFPGRETLLLSLGTGISSGEVFNPNFANVGKQLADLATQTEKEADAFFERDGAQAARSQRYFRFNIPNIGDIALDEAKELNTIKNAAEKFLNVGEVSLKIQSCSEQLAEGTSYSNMDEILKSLEPFAANPREATILSPHEDTFGWIWTEEKHNFVTWLEKSHDGVYWITGRPGSGKSTLMKFIVKDERTQKCLATEAGDLVHKLLCYYFYDMSELPTQQERSLDGLLHYLLYQLLGSFPNLQRKISNLFTQKVLPRYHGATGNLTSPWSLEYLKDALMEISEQKYVHGKICLFIDGFDECQGDFGKTLDFVLSWLGKMQASGLKVKICIASRYIHNITERLKPSLQQPSLKLHEWTRDDIQKYVQDHLNDAVGRSISLSSKSHRIVGNQLVSNVVGNAEGVFIWVKLVVADLESGLEECQEESQLQSRLKALPSELESLYEHIISEIPIRDLHAVFKYFRLLLRAPGDKCTLTLLQFLIAAQKPEEAITCEVEYYSEADHDQFLPQKLELMKDHLKRRCRNLIQIRSRKYASRRWDPLRRENVTFIHVTLKEFLKKPEVQQRIRDRITSSGMEIVASADTLLMASYLRLLKCQVSHIPHWAAAKTLMLKELRELKDESGSEKSQSPRSLTQKSFFDDHDEGDEAEYEEEIKRRAPDNAITKFFNYAQILETRLRKPQTAYIDELNKVLTKADPDWVSKFYYHKTSHQVHGMDILCLAVCCKLKLYVEQKSTSQLVNKERRPPLLFYAMNPPGWAHESVDLKILKLLLKKKVKLNESWVDNGREQTIWGHTFQHYLRIGTSYPEASWENVLDLLLKYRADPDQKVPLQGETYTTALHLLVDQYGKVSSKDHKQTVERGIERLIKHGADVENKDSSGITAYECAETSGQHVFSIFQKAVGDGLSDKRVATPTMMTRARRSVGIKSQNDSQTGNLPTCTGLNQEISATALEPSSSKTSSKTRSANLLQHNTSQKPQKDQMGSSSPTTVRRKGGHDGVQRRSKRLHSEIELDDAEEMQVEYQ